MKRVEEAIIPDKKLTAEQIKYLEEPYAASSDIRGILTDRLFQIQANESPRAFVDAC